jgi:hypothetical protein
LLHYQTTWFGFKSTIDYEGFFFSPSGQTDPVLEQAATRQALRSGNPKVGPHQLDPQCVFPARSRFFLEEFGDLPRTIVCDDFEHWRKNLKLQSVSLVFSSAYSGNPASMLGHTFLKLNLQNESGVSSPLLDYGASFSALPEDDWAMAYFVKGLTGGYKGVFSLDPYYTHVMSYVYRENRDLWEYRLNLSSRELSLFLEHFWELYAGAYADYFFLDDNCSSMLLEVLDAVRPAAHLSANKNFIILPHETVKRVYESTKNLSVTFIPSQKRQFLAFEARLSPAQRHRLTEIMDDQNREFGDDVLVIDAAIAFVNLQKSNTAEAKQGPLREREGRLLSRRAKFGNKSTDSVAIAADGPPHMIHPNRKLAVGIYSGEESGFYLRSRYGLHDLLDPGKGLPPYYHMIFFDLAATTDRSGAMQSMDFKIADVASLVPIKAFDVNLSWKGTGGVRSESDRCWQCVGLYGGGGIGATIEVLSRRWIFYSIPTIIVDASPHLVDGANATLRLDLTTAVFPAEFLRLNLGGALVYQRSRSANSSDKELFLQGQVSVAETWSVDFAATRTDGWGYSLGESWLF